MFFQSFIFVSLSVTIFITAPFPWSGSLRRLVCRCKQIAGCNLRKLCSLTWKNVVAGISAIVITTIFKICLCIQIPKLCFVYISSMHNNKEHRNSSHWIIKISLSDVWSKFTRNFVRLPSSVQTDFEYFGFLACKCYFFENGSFPANLEDIETVPTHHITSIFLLYIICELY